jgi:hypothetical protein
LCVLQKKHITYVPVGATSLRSQTATAGTVTEYGTSAGTTSGLVVNDETFAGSIAGTVTYTAVANDAEYFTLGIPKKTAYFKTSIGPHRKHCINYRQAPL